ncbi:MAG: hypothetical protein ACFB10_21770, partial [Salibacteraceae bacterium]
MLYVLLANLPVAISTFLYALSYKQIKGPAKWLAWFVFLTSGVQLLSGLLANLGTPNLFVLHFYVPIGGGLLIFFYREVLMGYIKDAVFFGAVGILLTGSLINTLFWQPLAAFNSIGLSVECVVIVILALGTFIISVNHEFYKKHQAFITHLNWINSGLFLYFSGNLLLFYFGHELLWALSIN